MGTRNPGTRKHGARRYAGAAGPEGVQVVEYVRDRRGLRALGSVHRPVASTDATDLATALVEAVAELGGGRGTLELALSGFGSAHHILTLPPADREVLQPIVRRELLRYYPDLKDPLIGFTAGPEVERGETPKREILVGSVPRHVAEALHGAMAARGIALTHLTVRPRALQGVYDAFDGEERPAVVVLLLETGPLIGCFHGGALRLFIEPPMDIHGRPVRAARAVAEQVSRAMLFLRQQFPTAGPPRMLVATPTGEDSELEATLRAGARAGTEEEVARLSELPAGSLIALGASLDAGGQAPLQLLPRRLRPRGAGEVWARRVAAAAAGVLVAAAVWWAGSAVLVARAHADAARAAEARVVAQVPWISAAAETLEARAAHAQRVLFLERSVASRREVGGILSAVAAAAPATIRLEALHVRRHQSGAWSLLLAGVATGPTGAAAVRSVDALYRGLPARLPVTEVELGELEGVSGDNGPVAIAFDMSFIVQWESDLQR